MLTFFFFFLRSPHLEVILYCTMSHRPFEMNLEEIGWSGWKPRKWRGILSGYCESVMARPRWETKPEPEVCSVTLKRTRKLSAFLPTRWLVFQAWNKCDLRKTFLRGFVCLFVCLFLPSCAISSLDLHRMQCPPLASSHSSIFWIGREGKQGWRGKRERERKRACSSQSHNDAGLR